MILIDQIPGAEPAQRFYNEYLNELELFNNSQPFADDELDANIELLEQQGEHRQINGVQAIILKRHIRYQYVDYALILYSWQAYYYTLNMGLSLKFVTFESDLWPQLEPVFECIINSVIFPTDK